MGHASHAERLKFRNTQKKIRRIARASEPVLLHEFFEKQVVLRPNKAAVEHNGQLLTYAQLNDEAAQIANLLRQRGVRPGSLVGLYMAKSCRLYAALLGVLKAGAGYVPLDLKFPVQRIQAILEDAAVEIVITEGAAGEAISPHVSAELIDLNRESDGDVFSPAEARVARPNDICYVIYTSGSTGNPKGVLIEHRNAVNFIKALHKVYGLKEDDRVYQGFSIAFDASVEEIWAALSLGGTLVVPSEETLRSTLDAAEFITAQHVTCFSTVPSFLALMKPDLPTLRLLILGGETCPPDLVARWARSGLRMLNTYGPTEATVVATAAECVPGEPVTIGVALPGYETYVLDDNQLPVKPDEYGELYIGGESVARGYRNLPELTAERFVPNPFPKAGAAPRLLYRTYDRVRLAEDGRLQFIGRVDSQIKIRGFRVELSEIEAVLMEHPSIRLATANIVQLGNSPEIAAYVVLAEGVAELERRGISELLRSRLPDYMVPKYLDILEEIPTTTSGKVDRKMLPLPHTLLDQSKRVVVPPATALERTIADVWEGALLIAPISIRDDFFLDVHGHSLVAAKIVTELREKLKTVLISIRDLYKHRTIEKLARYLESVGIEIESEIKPAESTKQPSFSALPPLARSRWICAALQLIGLLAFYGAISAPGVFAIILVLKVLGGEIEWSAAAEMATTMGFVIWPAWLALSIALKWIIIGRYKPGRYPVWGFYYFRWWLVSRFQQLSWSLMFVGTPLMSLYYRLMGAKVGKNCTIGTPLCTAFDLVSIGDNTSIGTDTHMLGYRVEDGWLILGNVSIGRDCFVGTHCCLGVNVAMHDNCRLDDLSLLTDNAVMAKGEARQGSPAVNADVRVPRCRRKRRWGANFLFGVIHLALIYAMGYILIFSAIPAIALVGYSLYVGGPAVGIGVAFATVPISILWYIQLVLLVKNLAIGKIFAGTYNLHSIAYLRYWFLNYLLENTRYIILPLYATVFLPRFLRQLGAKIGRMVEISTIMRVTPDLLEIGDGSFLADACIVGGCRNYDGVIEIGSNKIGNRTFVGNSAFVPAGVDLGDGGLVGVMSTTPAGVDRTADGTRWLGSPGFELPNIQHVTSFTSRETFEPSYFAIALRTLVDLLRVLLPGVLAMAGVILFCTAVVTFYRSLPLAQVVLLTPLIALALSFGSLLCVACLKKILMGTFVPTMKPLWSAYVWLNEVVNALYEMVGSAALMPLLGTPFASVFLRLMGCKIGRWVFLETTLLSEFDLIRIGDRASLNLGCTIQPHLFEDRVMKSDLIAIGACCSVGNMAVVLYSTDMQPGSTLGPLSVLMKGEALPALSRWAGIPTQPVISTLECEDHSRSSAAHIVVASCASARSSPKKLSRSLTDGLPRKRQNPDGFTH